MHPTCPFSAGLFQRLRILIDLIDLPYLSHIIIIIKPFIPLASRSFLIEGPEHHLLFPLGCLMLLTLLLLTLLLGQHSLALGVLLL